MTIRLFAAVVPPDPVLDALDVFVEPRRTADADLRWVARQNWHLTLAFFGDVPEDRLEPLCGALSAVHSAQIGVTLDGSGAFPNAAQARVLYRAVTDGAAELTALSRRVKTAGERVGVASDSARYRPHLTLARTRRPTELTRWLRVVDSFPTQRFTAGDFALVRSELRPSGALYRTLDRFELTGRPESE